MSEKHLRRDTGLARDNPAAPGAESFHSFHGRFDALRREEQGQTPEFAALWPRRNRTLRRRRGWLAATACALLVLAAMLWLRSGRRHPEPGAIASITEWKSPTDFLLETPGREVLRGVPEIGVWHGAAPSLFPRKWPSPVQKELLRGGRK